MGMKNNLPILSQWILIVINVVGLCSSVKMILKSPLVTSSIILMNQLKVIFVASITFPLLLHLLLLPLTTDNAMMTMARISQFLFPIIWLVQTVFLQDTNSMLWFLI